MAKKNRKPIYIFVLALIVLYIAIYVIPKATGLFDTTEVVEAGTLQVTEETTCYFVRNETVYEAGEAGTLDYNVEEGVHIRKGTRVLKLTESGDENASQKDAEEKSEYKDVIKRLGDHVVRTVSCEAQSSGVLSYYADGYENFFSPDTMDQLRYKNVKDLQIEASSLKREKAMQTEPLFKICDNENWYLLCWVEAASIARYEVGNDVTVQLPDGDVTATIQDITEDGEQWKITLRSNQYYESFAKSRIAEARLVSQEYDGLIVDNGAITTRNGETGVMVRQTSGDFAFTSIKVIASDGEYSVLEDGSFIDEDGNTVDTVNVYDEILKRPGKGS
ncbi:HlyD family efflux transporter periplasmic adaptor subunit [Zhenpiania hominis]|uniref:HlyD family efflux transporter periplasmic adaptor subunit n=1 Tax=Zhenpiania hominis TaxID=2763644 RepID=UPI0039F46A71